MTRLFLDKNQLSKVDLQITTSNLFIECEKCKNILAIGNSDSFLKDVRNGLENKLIYDGVEECGSVELDYFFECPICLKARKVPLKLKLVSEKTLLLFDTQINKESELLTKSVKLFEKYLKQGKNDDKKS